LLAAKAAAAAEAPAGACSANIQKAASSPCARALWPLRQPRQGQCDPAKGMSIDEVNLDEAIRLIEEKAAR